MKRLLLCLLLLLALTAPAQQLAPRILFLGNSYTYVNDLPAMIRSLAVAGGDTLIYDQHTPGGYTLEGHSSNPTVLNYLAMGNWDFLVMQEQSQRPSFPQAQVQQEVYPYAALLDSLFHAASPCGETVFFMTWGRKEGDHDNCSFWPPVCTYEGMQYELRRSYLNMANMNEATVAPVGSAWWEAILRNPLLELYNPDQSHPVYTGSYLSACVFYATIYRKTPVGLNFYGTLDTATAHFLQDVAADVVFDSLDLWRIGANDVGADFAWSVAGGVVSFTDSSRHATTWAWDFGDGASSTLQHPQHSYTAPGTYTVTLVVSDGCTSDTLQTLLNIVSVGSASPGGVAWKVGPNPAHGTFTISGEGIPIAVVQVRIVDMEGQVVFAEVVHVNGGSFHRTIGRGEVKWVPGMYFVEMGGGGYRWVQKVVLE